MAAKLLHTLTDENPDLERQIGCMTGIFHLFDRQHILTGGGRHIVSPKRHHSSGRFHGSGNTLEGDSCGKYSNIQEKQRTFSELSRGSFSSSSRSSSFSSLDYNRATQLEPASFDRIIFPETPSMDPEISLKNSSPQFSRRSLDLRDFVKDSMYREVQGLSKPKTIDMDGNLPRLQSKISDGSYLDTKQRIRADLKESVRVLAELQQSPWYPNEPRELMRSSSYHAKDGSSLISLSSAPPRFSCDGREVNREPFHLRDIPKSALKLKDLRRFSLDIMDRPVRSSKLKDNDELDHKVRQARPPSVVAKLMGLEALPGPVSSSGSNAGSGRSCPEKDFVKADSNLIKLSGSSKNSQKDPSSPRWRNLDSSTKPMPRVPIERAPWKQTDGSKKPVSKTMRTRAKAPAAFPSVYSEIEERLKDLEFTRSGRDLRALKQILEAMQSKGFLETEKGLYSNSTGQKDPTPRAGQVLGLTKRRAGSSPHYESPIVIMKPASLVGKSASVMSLDVVSDLPKSRDDEVPSTWNSLGAKKGSNAVNYVDRSLKGTSMRSQQFVKDGSVGSRRSSESISPRMQQKMERRSRPPTPPDSTSKSKRQSSKQQHGDCNSPGSRRRLKKSTPVEDESAEIGFVPPEYSSPVSVLDNAACNDSSNSPSPVKDVEKTQEESSTDGFVPGSVESNSMSAINLVKLQNIDNLVWKLRKLNTNRDANYIASLSENINPDHSYISEILLASGAYLSSFPFHSSDHPINPELFSILEQTKTSTQFTIYEKLHRKLIFDTVNEILARELSPFSEARFQHSKTVFNMHKLLRKLCLEIEEIRAKNAKSNEEEEARWQKILSRDIMHQMDFHDGMSGAVLAIERLIFKDLVSEIVVSESVGSKTGFGRRRLFAK